MTGCFIYSRKWFENLDKWSEWMFIKEADNDDYVVSEIREFMRMDERFDQKCEYRVEWT